MKAAKAPEWCACGLEPVDAPSKLGRLCRLERAARLRQEAAEGPAARGYETTSSLTAALDEHMAAEERILDEAHATVAQLAAAQGITGPQDLESLRAPEPETEEDRAAEDAFELALARGIEPWEKPTSQEIADDPDAAAQTAEGEAGDRGTDGPPVATNECPTCHQHFDTQQARIGHQRWCGKPRRKRDFSDPDPDWPKCEVCGFTRPTLQAVNAHRFQAHGLRGTHARARQLGTRPASERGPDEHVVDLKSGGRVTLIIEANIFDLDERDRLLIFGLVDRIRAYESRTA